MCDFQSLYEQERKIRENIELEREDLLMRVQKYEWDGEIKQDSKDQLSREIEDLKSQLKNVKLSEIQNYDKSLDRMDLGELKREYRKQASRLTTLERDMDSKTKENEKIIIKYRESEKKNIKTSSDLAESEKEKFKLDRELKEMKSRVIKMESTFEKARATSKSDDQKYLKLKELKDEVEKKYMDLKKQKETNKGKLEELEPLYHNLVLNHQMCVKELENALCEKSALEEALSRKVSELEEERMMVETMNNKMKHMSSQLQNEMSRKQKDGELKQELEGEISRNREKMCQWEESCEQLKHSCQRLTDQLNILDRSLNEMNHKNTELSFEKQRHLEEIERLTREKKETIHNFQNDIHHIQSENDIKMQQAQFKSQDQESKISNLEFQVEHLSKEAHIRDLRLNQVDSENFRLQQRQMNLDLIIQESECRINQLSHQKDDYQQEVVKLEQKLKECLDQVSANVVDSLDFRNQVGSLSKQNSDLTTFVEEKNSLLLQMELKLEKTKTKLRTTEQTIMNLSKEKDQLLAEVDDSRTARELLESCKRRNEKLSLEVTHLMRLLDDKSQMEKDDQIKKYQLDLIEMESKIAQLEEERDDFLRENPFEKIEELTRQLNNRVKPILKFKACEEPL